MFPISAARRGHTLVLGGLLLLAGWQLSLELAGGEMREYRVQSIRVVDTRHENLNPPAMADPHLLLVTCYPFASGDVNGPLRYVVLARSA